MGEMEKNRYFESGGEAVRDGTFVKGGVVRVPSSLLCLNLRSEKAKSLSRVQFFATPWTVAYQAPPSMIFSMQEYWSGLPFPSPGDLPNPGIKPGFPALEADTLTSEPPGNCGLFSCLYGRASAPAHREVSKQPVT